ncbi:MAG: hypothetical protein ABSG85_04590 [Spirochaetia bacterium]
MDSGLFVQVLSSAEVIAAALFVILLLPLVFFIASTRSRRRFVRRPPRGRIAKPARRSVEAPKPGEQEEDLDEPAGPRSRARGPAAGPEDGE